VCADADSALIVVFPGTLPASTLENGGRYSGATVGEACKKAEWEVHAYCLMGNHFHLVVETPKRTPTWTSIFRSLQIASS